MANASNVLQPYWFIVLPLDIPAVTASLLLWGPSGQRWWCLWTFLFSNVPTFATSRLYEILAAKGGREMADEFCLKMPDFHLIFRNLLHAVNLRHGTNGFTSLQKEGVLRIFSPWKIRRLRPGLNTIQYTRQCSWWWTSNSFETCRARKKGGTKFIYNELRISICNYTSFH